MILIKVFWSGVMTSNTQSYLIYVKPFGVVMENLIEFTLFSVCLNGWYLHDNHE